MTRRNGTFFVMLICLMIALFAFCLLCREASAADASSTSTNENTNSLTLVGPIHQHVPGKQKITNDVRTSPNVPGLPYLDNPGYFGPFAEQGWNTMEGSTLPFLLSQDHGWIVTRNHWWTSSDAKYRLERITKKDYPIQEAVKILVIDSSEDFIGIEYKALATLVTYGGIKTTSVACFKEAVYQTSITGGNVFLILKASNTPGVYSHTIGFGGSGAGNFDQGGNAAYSSGTALGFAMNKGNPVYSPYMQGVVLLVDSQTYKNLHPGASFFEKVKSTRKKLSKGELSTVIRK